MTQNAFVFAASAMIPIGQASTAGNLTFKSTATIVAKEGISMGAGAGAQKITTDVTGNDTAGMVAGMVASGVTAKGLNGIEAEANKLAKAPKGIDGVTEGAGNLAEDVGKVVESGSGSKPYTNSRPSYGKNQVNEVWENAKDPITGKVYDPSGVEITWDKTKPRNGQWDMGHIPGEKYSEMHQLYMDDVISKDEFLEWYRNPKNYRPELPSTNRSHKYE